MHYSLIIVILLVIFSDTITAQINLEYKPMRPFYHPNPGNYIGQIVPPGKPWPDKAEGYQNFSVTTPQKPLLEDRFKETTSSTTGRPSFHPSPFDNVAQIIPPGKPWPDSPEGYHNFSVTTEKKPALEDRFNEGIKTSTTGRPSFHPYPWDNIGQIVPPGKPWPSNAEGYHTTIKPTLDIDDRINEGTKSQFDIMPIFHTSDKFKGSINKKTDETEDKSHVQIDVNTSSAVVTTDEPSIQTVIEASNATDSSANRINVDESTNSRSNETVLNVDEAFESSARRQETTTTEDTLFTSPHKGDNEPAKNEKGNAEKTKDHEDDELIKHKDIEKEEELYSHKPHVVFVKSQPHWYHVPVIVPIIRVPYYYHPYFQHTYEQY